MRSFGDIHWRPDANTARAMKCALVVVGLIIFSACAASAQWIGNDSGMCPNGHWVPSGPGMMCVNDPPQIQQPLCPANTQYCGNTNQCCNPGFYCSHYGCTPLGAVECGNHYCNPGTQCGSRNTCQALGDVDCGNGRSCNEGLVCGRGGNTCLTQEQAVQQQEEEQRQQAERRRQEQERKEAIKSRREYEAEQRRQAVEQRKEAARQKKEEAEAKRQAAIDAKKQAEEEKREVARQKEEERKAGKARKIEEAEAARQAVIDAKRQAVEAETKRKADAANGGTQQPIAEQLQKMQQEQNRTAQPQNTAQTKQDAALVKQMQAICLSASSSQSQNHNAKFLVAQMCDPSVDISLRKLDAIALGLDPNLVGNPTPTSAKIGVLNQIKVWLGGSIATLTPPTSSANPQMPTSAPFAPPPINSAVTGFYAAPVDFPQSANLWDKLENAAAFANSSAATDPNFQSGMSNLKTTAEVETAGCVAGALVGAVTAGVLSGPGCVGGALLAGEALSVGEGIKDLYQQKSAITLPEATKAAVEYAADKGSDSLPVPVPVSSAVEAGGSWGTYFLYAFYTGQ